LLGPKYRRDVLQGEVQQRVQELFADIVEQYDITIEEGEFWEDGYFARTVGDKGTAEVIRRKRRGSFTQPLVGHNH
jgi:REP element-mobilizing transposase RayT